MADVTINNLGAYTTPISTDVLPIVDTTNVITKKVTVGNLGATGSGLTLNGFSANATPTANNIPVRDASGNLDASGWMIAGTLTYSSADAPTYVVTVASGAASIYGVGDRVKLTDSTVKYFIITAVTDTTLTLYGGTDYTLSGGAITLPYYSHQKAPLGFPMSPVKWAVYMSYSTEVTQASPTADAYYNVGTTNAQITIPIGVWNMQMKYAANAIFSLDTGRGLLTATLSTTNNSASNAEFTVQIEVPTVNSGSGRLTLTAFGVGSLTLTSKTLWYVNTRTYFSAGSVSSIAYCGEGIPTYVRAICAYL
jgi:hypothetical protein